VQLEFNLHPDGSVSDLLTTPVPRPLGGHLCLRAVLDLVPFSKCSPRLQETIAGTNRHVRLTFRYGRANLATPPWVVTQKGSGWIAQLWEDPGEQLCSTGTTAPPSNVRYSSLRGSPDNPWRYLGDPLWGPVSTDQVIRSYQRYK
jgi:hypothetical protein